MQENNLKGLWIPYEILTNEHLNDKEKYIYSLILFFSKNDGYCTITNKYIANIVNLSDTRVSKLVSSLSKKKYVQVITNFQDLRHSCATLLIQNKVPVKDIQIWLGHSNIQTTMIYSHLDETNKEVSAQVLMAKFQFILTNYNENEIYEMKDETLNNIYEQDIEKVVATLQN